MKPFYFCPKCRRRIVVNIDFTKIKIGGSGSIRLNCGNQTRDGKMLPQKDANGLVQRDAEGKVIKVFVPRWKCSGVVVIKPSKQEEKQDVPTPEPELQS